MRLPLLLLATLTALAGCNSGTESSRSVSNAWIRLAAVEGRPAAGYATVAATPDHVALVSVTSPSAGRIEIHETMTHGTMAGMRKLDRIDVSKEREIVFAPGGRHLMLFDLDAGLKPGGEADLVFHYENGGTSTLPARIVAAGDENPFEK
jgi:copper(I)-binding protein